MKKRTACLSLVCLLVLAAVLAWVWPRSAEYYYERGLSKLEPYDDDGDVDTDGARADFNHAIRLNPQFASAYRERAGLDGDGVSALADYNRAIELDPKDVRNYTARAWFREDKGDLDSALADLSRAIEMNPKDYLLFGRRALLKFRKGDFSGMVADKERASEVFPPGPAHQVSLADALTSGREPTRLLPRLIRIYDRAIEQNPGFYWGYFHRGVLKHLANDSDGALADFRRCSDFPDNSLKDYAAIHLWLVRAQKGETNEANRELSAYLDTRTHGTPRDWEVQIAKFLLNRMSEADFFAAIGVSDAERERSQFWYYAAMKQLLAGDKVKAADYFSKSRSTETRPYAVAISSQIELSALGQ
jgi:tetratricopeptide (TPR) repeat protein